MLRIGLIPATAALASAQADTFVEAIQSALGETVEIHQAADYRGLSAAIETGVAHMAWMPPVPAARAVRTGGVVPLVVTVRNGTTTYSSGLFSYVRGRVASLDDLHGVRAAWVDRESASGYVVIRASLRARGIRLTTAFSDEIFCRGHAEVARAVREGRADVGATFFSFQSGTRDVARAGWRDGGLRDDDVRLLAHAGPIPSDVFVVNDGVSTAQRKALESALVDARPALAHQLAKDLLHADSFVRATNDHTAMLHELRAMVDTPLASWPPPR